jgi:hypothetical protein
MVVMNFERSKLNFILESPFEMIFFVFIKNSMPNGYIIEISKWTFMDFIGFSFKTSKAISPY